MKIDWFNPDEFCKDLPEVTSPKLFCKKGFDPEGLFSEKIFGPTKNCTCSCGTYWGRSKIGMVCPDCGVKIDNNNVRRKNMAKITLPFPIINPIMFYIIQRVGKITISNMILSMIYDADIIGYYYNQDQKKYFKIKKPANDLEQPEIPDGVKVYSGPQGTFELVKDECERKKDTSRYWKYIYDHLNYYWMSSVGVVPPEFRPVSKTKDQQMRDEMNKYYLIILEFIEVNKENQLLEDHTSDIYKINFKNLQKYVFELYEYIFSKFSKKTGLIRGSILGKRIDFSGRAVIGPDPELELDQCGIPYLMALEFFKLQVVNRLLEIKNFNGMKFVRFDPALKFVDRCLETNDTCLLDIVKEIATDKLFILNRQPTLHRMGLMSFRAKIHTDYTIKIHPFACEPYNADFDGDQMAAYVSLYPETEESNREHLYIMSNLISPSTGDLCLSVNQDVVLGLYLLTRPGNKEDIVEYNGIKTYPGRIEFNKILPEGFPFYNETLTKKNIHILLNVIAKNYDSVTVKQTLDGVKKLGFSKTTEIGSTFSLKNLSIDPRVYDEISKIADNSNLTLAEKFFALAEHPLKKQVEASFPYSDFIKSGSRGTWDQADQLIWCRGYVSNSQGEVVETPIKNNLVHGLTKNEFFTSCYGARKALLDVALNTAVSGYLTRKLVYCDVNVELDENCDDCGTTDYLEITIPEELTDEKIQQLTAHITDEAERKLEIDKYKYQRETQIDPKKLARSLRYRWYMDSDGILKQITETNYLSFIGKTIKLRSPIFCKNPKLCKKCYGELHKYLHSKYVGVVSAQALGEVATQLTLRTFHVGGVAQMNRNQQDNSQKDIINDLGRVKRILHGGSDWNTRGFKPMIEELFDIYSRHKVLMLVHFELAVSQIMRVGAIRWRLHPDRSSIEPEIVSIERVPSCESFLLALAFSKPYSYIIGGILGASQPTDGILEKMLTNKA